MSLFLSGVPFVGLFGENCYVKRKPGMRSNSSGAFPICRWPPPPSAEKSWTRRIVRTESSHPNLSGGSRQRAPGAAAGSGGKGGASAPSWGEGEGAHAEKTGGKTKILQEQFIFIWGKAKPPPWHWVTDFPVSSAIQRLCRPRGGNASPPVGNV